jgi:hypothetical protein
MSAPAPSLPVQRHALGLPAGSIRALLALSILALLWLLALNPPHEVRKLPYTFIYLQILMVLILAHYFGAHGSTIRGPGHGRSPLGLPRGSVRLVLLAGYAGLAYYLYKTRPDFEMPQKGDFVIMVALLLSGFFVGHYLTALVRAFSGPQLPYAFQDFQAWLALLAVIGLGILVIIHLFINPSVSPENVIPSVHLDMVLAAIVGFYFGSRS